MNKTNSRQVDFNALRRDMEAALESVCQKHGIKSMSANGISYSDFDFTVKVSAKMHDSPQKMSAIESDLAFLGLPKDLIGKTCVIQGRNFEITGVNTRKPKNCIVIKDLGNGKTFICPKRSIASIL